MGDAWHRLRWAWPRGLKEEPDEPAGCRRLKTETRPADLSAGLRRSDARRWSDLNKKEADSVHCDEPQLWPFCDSNRNCGLVVTGRH